MSWTLGPPLRVRHRLQKIHFLSSNLCSIILSSKNISINTYVQNYHTRIILSHLQQRHIFDLEPGLRLTRCLGTYPCDEAAAVSSARLHRFLPGKVQPILPTCRGIGVPSVPPRRRGRLGMYFAASKLCSIRPQSSRGHRPYPESG